MQVHSIENSSLYLKLGREDEDEDNFIDILTGPNGCGKTEVLDILIRHFARIKTSTNYDPMWRPPTVTSSGHPQKIIVQTFSPFSRFIGPNSSEVSLDSVFSGRYLDEGRHISIGLHRTSKNAGFGLSRNILEDAIFRLCGNPRASEYLFSALGGLGFQTQFELSYRVKKAHVNLFNGVDDIRAYVLSLIDRSKSKKISERWRKVSDSIDFLSTLEESMSICMEYRENDTDDFHYKIIIDILNIRRYFYALQAFAILKKLELLSLDGCYLRSEYSNKSVDVANISSGQQQMLCAIFGLATSINDDCLVILDEPELSLHPEWQIKFTDALFEMIEMVSGTHVVIATHSPLIVQRAAQYGANVTRMEDGKRGYISSETVSDEISVEEALVKVFHTPISESSHVSNEIFQAVALGETGTEFEKSLAIARLHNLQKIYINESYGKTQSLISNAISLLKG